MVSRSRAEPPSAESSSSSPSSETQDPKTNETPVSSHDVALSDHILPPNLFILPVNSPIVFPSLLAPLVISEPRFVSLIEEAMRRQRMVGLVLTRESELKSTLGVEQLYSVGVLVRIVKRMKMQDDVVSILVHSIKRFEMKKILSQTPHIVAEVKYLEDIQEKSMEVDALTRAIIIQVRKLSEVNPFFTDEMRLAMINAPGPGTIADLVAFSLTLPKGEAQEYLETLSIRKRLETLLVHLKREQNLADLQKKIHEEVNQKLSKMQREFFLREQLKSIKKELGMEVDGKEKSSKTFQERIEAAQMPEEIQKVAFDELEKLESISEASPEYNLVRNYLETLCSLPWSQESEDQLHLESARKILEEEHYGLKKIKERILEFLAVRKLKPQLKGSILCLVGPPGVGKTSIGKSIAKTLGRKFFRFSLGGMRDEAEIKGHRRTYIGAMPGKIIQGLKRTKTKNPVFMLDEIDKLGSNYHGDPASALLEVLDPEQNTAFLDHYLDLPFDLSHILFITTANDVSSILPPLLDRMEVIELSGYTLEEKEIIATQYVIPKELETNGLKPEDITLQPETLKKIMLDYAREPGLRSLQKCIHQIARKAAMKRVLQQEAGQQPTSLVLDSKDLLEWLGPQRFYNEVSERIILPGVIVGLAWTSTGGEILFLEAAQVAGSGQLKLTGQMGEVMVESASIAWSYVKKKLLSEKRTAKKSFKEIDIHIHIPAGAIPKDGPSAGIALACVLYSLFSERPSVQKQGMTGELSLTGKVLPIGGIKEKLLAAKRAGLQAVILPKLNQKDLYDIPPEVKQGLKLHFVSHIEEVFPLALEKKSTQKK